MMNTWFKRFEECIDKHVLVFNTFFKSFKTNGHHNLLLRWKILFHQFPNDCKSYNKIVCVCVCVRANECLGTGLAVVDSGVPLDQLSASSFKHLWTEASGTQRESRHPSGPG